MLRPRGSLLAPSASSLLAPLVARRQDTDHAPLMIPHQDRTPSLLPALTLAQHLLQMLLPLNLEPDPDQGRTNVVERARGEVVDVEPLPDPLSLAGVDQDDGKSDVPVRRG